MQWLGVSRGEALISVFRPGYFTWSNGFFAEFFELFRILTSFGAESVVLNFVVGCLNHYGAYCVVPGAPSSSGYLVEFAGLEHALLGAVEFGEPCHEDGADGYVDADAEGVGAADDFQQPCLGEFFYEASILGQHASVVHADAFA